MKLSSPLSSSGSSSSCSSIIDTPDSSLLSDIGSQGTIEQYVADILNCYNTLIDLPNLDPCATVNKAFGELMEICLTVPKTSIVNAILENPQIALITSELQRICSVGECNLEKYWAAKIITTSKSEDEAQSLLKAFPYHTNYTDLTRMELAALHTALHSTSPSHPLTRIAFLGCGPLPLTSLCILSQLLPSSPFILNVDHDLTALTLANQLCVRLGIPSTGMAFSHDEAGSPQNHLEDFDVVYIAALVGTTSDGKREIFGEVLKQMRPGALLIVRTAHGLRRLLYPAVEVETDLDPDMFEPVMVVHPYNHVVNSVIVGRVRASSKLTTTHE